MKVNIISHTDKSGGASRAAYRLLKSLNKKKIKTEMIVSRKLTDDYQVKSASKFKQNLSSIINIFSRYIQSKQKTKNPILHSSNFFGSNVFNMIQKSNADIINLHWINSETLSIKQIKKINKPIVMTLHDMWAFCGSEHLSIDSEMSEFRLGYKEKKSESDYISGINLNKRVWDRKIKYWNTPFVIITPSRWLAKCTRESRLFRDWEIYTIPNALDTTVYKPIDKNMAKEFFNFPKNKKIIGFGAMGGGDDPNKGFDLLKEALEKLSDKCDYHCVIFGQSKPINAHNISIDTEYVGRLYDDYSMSLFYNAIDVMVVPSRQESFGQTASEAQSCGVPVVAFNSTGLTDVIQHKVTGYLAEPFSTSDLVFGIEWIFRNHDLIDFKKNARFRAITLWSMDVIATQYEDIFSKILSRSSKRIS